MQLQIRLLQAYQCLDYNTELHLIWQCVGLHVVKIIPQQFIPIVNSGAIVANLGKVNNYFQGCLQYFI